MSQEASQFQSLAREMISKRSWLQHLPLILPGEELTQRLTVNAELNPYEFSWSVCFDVDFVAQLMYAGYLTMCEKIDPRRFILFPKLHHKRCVLFLKNLHIERRKKQLAKRFTISINKAFAKVCAGIIEQHGENWFYPPLVECFKEFNSRGRRGGFHERVHLVSVELWDADDELVAGEVGYSIGSCYTSLSGFTKKRSTGSVQLLGLGLLLRDRGYDLWDLGMGMDYKYKLGAEDLERHEFLKEMFKRRNNVATVKPIYTCPPTPISQLLPKPPEPKPAPSEQTDDKPLSKNQLKKRLKREKKLQRKKQNQQRQQSSEHLKEAATTKEDQA